MTVRRYVGNKRLLALADFLDKLDPTKFDYNYWVGVDWAGAKDLSCGTTACALGWATAMPKFQRLGLYLDQDFEVRLHNEGESRDPYGIDAAEQIFGLDNEDAYELFVPNNGEEDATPQYVATKIRNLVAGRS